MRRFFAKLVKRITVLPSPSSLQKLYHIYITSIYCKNEEINIGTMPLTQVQALFRCQRFLYATLYVSVCGVLLFYEV